MNSKEMNSLGFGSWDNLLSNFQDARSRSINHGIKHHLAILGLAYAWRSFSQSSIPENKNLEFYIHLADEVGTRTGDNGFRYLFHDLERPDTSVLTEWRELTKKSEILPQDIFTDWFESRIAQLTFGNRYDTPPTVSVLAAKLAIREECQSVLDPFCGTGGFLAAASAENRNLAIFGQDVSQEACAWTRLRLLVSGNINSKLAIGDAISSPAFIRDNKLPNFDVVLCNPPFGAVVDSSDVQRHDLFHRFFVTGTSGRLPSETAFVQHALASLNPRGRAFVIVPRGFLFRTGVDQKVREMLLDRDVVEAVIALPERLFAPATSIETALLCLNKAKPADHRRQVLLIDASREGERSRVRTALPEALISKIVAWFQDWPSDEPLCLALDHEIIAAQGCSLQPSRYIAPQDKPDVVDWHARRVRIAELDELHRSASAEFDELVARLSTVK